MILTEMPANDRLRSMPMVSFIIPVLNDAAGLDRCLRSIHANARTGVPFEVLVADNGSTDGSDTVAERLGATVVKRPGASVAALRNQVAALASGDVLAFVDADHELSPDWLRSAIVALRQPGAVAAGAHYHPPDNATWVQRLYDSFRPHVSAPEDARWLGSGNLVVWAWAFRAVDGFDTSLTACEDVDLCQRLRRGGHRLIADERLRSVHHGDPATLAQLFKSELWRGRDNLAVSFRGPLALRDVPSVALPVVVLCSIVALPFTLMAAAAGVAAPLVAALAITALAPLGRAILIAQRSGERSLRGLAQAFLVASTYDVARALALVMRKPHRRA